jgi:hypothetical protein
MEQEFYNEKEKALESYKNKKYPIDEIEMIEYT